MEERSIKMEAQLNEALERLELTNDKLDDTKEELEEAHEKIDTTNNTLNLVARKLDIAVDDRVVKPKQLSMQEQLLAEAQAIRNSSLEISSSSSSNVVNIQNIVKHKESNESKVNIQKRIHTSGNRKKLSSNKKIKQEETEKPKINSNSIISLTLPNNENSKGDQAQKLSMITKKKPRHWEKRWVLIPNVFEFTKEIWLKKWVLVDEGEDISENNVRS
jgi:exonuclease VII small subunit